MNAAYRPSASAVQPVSRVSRVLVPTDFSSVSMGVVDATVAMALASPGTSVTVVHVVDPRNLPDEGPEHDSLHHRPCDLSSAINRADRMMKEFRSACENKDVVDTRIVTGSAARVICDMAKDEGYGLIVMSSHGHTGLAHVLIGSVAEQVVQHAPCPVLVAKAPKDRTGKLSSSQPRFRFGRILVGYDHRAGARHALNMARALGDREDSHITLVHALEWKPSLQKSQVDAEACAACEGEALERLSAVRATQMPAAKDWELRVEVGEPWDVLVEISRKLRSDLIVVGPHEHTRWGHAYVGSTAQRVVRMASAPVLVVK